MISVLQYLWSNIGLTLYGILLSTWLVMGYVMDWSEAWYRLADAPIFWISLFLTLLIQRGQDKEMSWMEDRLSDLEQAITGNRSEHPREE